MKKTISIVLSVLMLVCMIPMTAFAGETITFDKSTEFTKSDQLLTGNTYLIPDGVTMSVPSGLTLYIPTGGQLIVEKGGKLVVNGNIITLQGGALRVKGYIVNANNVSGAGDNLAEIRFPSLANAGLDGKDGKENKIKVSYAFSAEGGAYEDMSGKLTFNDVSDTGASVWAPFNQFMFIRAAIVEPVEKYNKYDDALMNVYLNGVGIPFKSGTHNTTVSVAGDVTYSKWTKDSDFFSTFNIYLPTGKGYTVYGREGEQSTTGETVKLKYGQPFSFKVEIDPEYDMSSYEVYIYNGYGWTNLDTETLLKDIEPAKPDEYGYYNIPEVKGEHTIYVVGVVENETLLLISDIFDFMRNVFEMISAFFTEIGRMMGFIK